MSKKIKIHEKRAKKRFHSPPFFSDHSLVIIIIIASSSFYKLYSFAPLTHSMLLSNAITTGTLLNSKKILMN